jgi:hypothetical protein
VLFAWVVPTAARASDMDLTLARLRIPPGRAGCTGVVPCPDNEAFERLASELAATLAPAISHGAASIGPAGFYFGLSAAVTPVSASKRYWVQGTEGAGGVSSPQNTSPSGALLWNRFEARKGLPLGFELGASVGQGASTSMWLVGAELKWAIFEGFHSGLGQFPDLSVSGVLQSSVGARELTLRTDALNVTLSKPFLVARRYRLTPFAGLQALFVRAKTSRVDLTPGVNAWASCAQGAATAESQAVPACTGDGNDLGSNVAFRPVSQTRTRIFLGLDGTTEWFSTGLSLGIDAGMPGLQASTPKDGESSGLQRQFTFQLSFGVRY